MASITNLSGDIVNFSTSLEKPLQNLKIHFNPIQEGEGDPSPDNVRPITGWTGINLYHSTENMVSNETIPISWESEYGNIYGGYVDLVNGELVAEWIDIPVRLRNHDSSTTDYRSFRMYCDYYITDAKSNIFTKAAANPSTFSVVTKTWDGTWLTNGIWIKIPIEGVPDTSIATAQKYLDDNNTTFIVKLRDPIHYDLTSQNIKTLCGTNNIWSDSNDDIDVSYLDRSGSMLEYRKNIIINSPHIESVSDNIASFNTDMISSLKDCKINFSPIQYGTGDPSPENVREIHGWTGINIWQGKENKIVFIDPVTVSSNGMTWTINPNGSISYEGTPTGFTGKIIGYYYVKGGEKIKIRMTGDIYNLTTDTCNIYDINNSLIGSIGDSVLHNRWVDLSEYPDAYRVRINLKRNRNDIYMHGTVYCDIDVNEVPSSTLFSTSWETGYGEIYGGYINPLTGTGKIEWWHHTFTGDETFYQVNTWVTSYLSIDGYKANAQNPAVGVCSHYPYGPYGRGKIGVMYNEKACIFDGNIYDADGWKQYCADQYQNGTPVQIAYKLRDPIDFSLDPITLKSLRGTNNIWTNSNGPTEIKYWTH